MDLLTRKMHIMRIFYEILTDNGRTFPREDVSCPSARISSRQLFDDFKTRLTKWRGKRQIGFTKDGYPKITKDRLLLPLDVTDKKELYSKLIVATFNTSSFKGLYGGRRLMEG